MSASHFNKKFIYINRSAKFSTQRSGKTTLERNFAVYSAALGRSRCGSSFYVYHKFSWNLKLAFQVGLNELVKTVPTTSSHFCTCTNWKSIINDNSVFPRLSYCLTTLESIEFNNVFLCQTFQSGKNKRGGRARFLFRLSWRRMAISNDFIIYTDIWDLLICTVFCWGQSCDDVPDNCFPLNLANNWMMKLMFVLKPAVGLNS